MERSSCIAFALFLVVTLAVCSCTVAAAVADTHRKILKGRPAIDDPMKPRGYIIVLQRPNDVNMEVFDIGVLAPVLGSKEAAEKAIKYTFKFYFNGFFAILTPQQADELKKQQNVLRVIQSQYFVEEPDD